MCCLKIKRDLVLLSYVFKKPTGPFFNFLRINAQNDDICFWNYGVMFPVVRNRNKKEGLLY